MVLVDTNVLLDILTADPQWFSWSSKQLERAGVRGLAIHPIIYAALAASFHEEEELEASLSFDGLGALAAAV